MKKIVFLCVCLASMLSGANASKKHATIRVAPLYSIFNISPIVFADIKLMHDVAVSTFFSYHGLRKNTVTISEFDLTKDQKVQGQSYGMGLRYSFGNDVIASSTFFASLEYEYHDEKGVTEMSGITALYLKPYHLFSSNIGYRTIIDHSLVIEFSFGASTTSDQKSRYINFSSTTEARNQGYWHPVVQPTATVSLGFNF